MAKEQDQLNQLVDAVRASPKYRAIGVDYVRNIGARELSKRRNLKEAIKATKNKLHQVGGAYQDLDRYDDGWLAEVQAAFDMADRARLHNACRQIMQHHSSTRERLPILDEFFTTLLADLPPIRSVIDIACGLNPVALPWMPLAEDAAYYAYDIFQDMIDFLNRFMSTLHIDGAAQVWDVLQSVPEQPVDLAFVLKTIPCLEQVDKTAGVRLLEALNAKHLVVSFPAQSLGGRNKGMIANYEARFDEIIADKPWTVKRFVFNTELAFLISK